MLSEKAKAIGSFYAFPSPQEAVTNGMSYREWLIGLALQGFLANPQCSGKRFVDYAKDAIGQADTVLELLARESDND